MDKEKKAFLGMVKNLTLTFLILWATFSLFIGVKMAPNEDMEPRMSAGDILIYYRLGRNPSSREVMVIRKNGTDYVARVVAYPGNTVQISKEENLVINGNTVIEKGIYGTTPMYEGFVDYPIKLKKDEYFVLADRREGGEDSRYYGPVKKSEFRGTVIGQFRRSGI